MQRPVAPIDLTEKLKAPLIGIFGNDDQNPNKDAVNKTEETLKKLREIPGSAPFAGIFTEEGIKNAMVQNKLVIINPDSRKIANVIAQ